MHQEARLNVKNENVTEGKKIQFLKLFLILKGIGCPGGDQKISVFECVCVFMCVHACAHTSED